MTPSRRSTATLPSSHASRTDPPRIDIPCAESNDNPLSSPQILSVTRLSRSMDRVVVMFLSTRLQRCHRVRRSVTLAQVTGTSAAIWRHHCPAISVYLTSHSPNGNVKKQWQRWLNRHHADGSGQIRANPDLSSPEWGNCIYMQVQFVHPDLGGVPDKHGLHLDDLELT